MNATFKRVGLASITAVVLLLVAAGVVLATRGDHTTASPVTKPPAPKPVAVPIVTSLSQHSGWTNGGQKLTIKGTGFDKTSTVKFGRQGKPTKVRFINAKKLVVVTPRRGTGTIRVTVSNEGGWSAATPRARFTFKKKPLPLDNCPGGDYTSSRHDHDCGSKPTPRDYCANGDYTSSHYDGRCGSALRSMDSCPLGDYTGDAYDGACGSRATRPTPKGSGPTSCPTDYLLITGSYGNRECWYNH